MAPNDPFASAAFQTIRNSSSENILVRARSFGFDLRIPLMTGEL